MPLQKKAPYWFVMVRTAAKTYTKVECYLPKNGVSAQGRARKRAEVLAKRHPACRVFVLRPRAKFEMVSARPAGLNVTEI